MRTFAEQLRVELAKPLPGRTAHRSASVELAYGRHQGPLPPTVSRAAVLVLLVPVGDSWVLPLTVRNHQLRHHAGQISFPGGRLENGEDVFTAAIREAEEEIGLRPDQVEVIGQLSPLHVFASRFHVTPVVAVANETVDYTVNETEVERVLELPTGDIQLSRDFKEISFGDLSFRGPSIRMEAWEIWGATAMMLAELAVILENVKKP